MFYLHAALVSFENLVKETFHELETFHEMEIYLEWEKL